MLYTVALIGNPNVGKSVVFNNMVPGARQHVGNWPGKTVDKKFGKFSYRGTEIDVVDLPGTYSLTARAVDELIARNFIVEEKPDIVVNIVDASNIERNLYLTLLLLELNTNVVVALNMMDIADEKGYEIDVENLSERLGVPVIPIVATKKQGMDRLKDAILEAVKRKSVTETKITYGVEIEGLVDIIIRIINKDTGLAEKYPVRWMAIKLLEKDEDILEKIKGSTVEGEILKALA
ncbi:MAG: 50S ribosome-binding GTPase [Candidatus Bathyarchaeota archaeon]|nr:50S ribosome-binding GTPase [Candidatus Bathyarchaeota archaeon]